MNVTLTKKGDDLLLSLPPEAVTGLAWNSGDICEAIIVDGQLRVRRIMTKHDHAMQLARRGIENYRETFEALAKS